MTSLEARLSALEQQVGKIANAGGGGSEKSSSSLTNRLDGIQSSATTLLPLAQRDLWKESTKLLNDLDPGMALTHQQQPLLYKRQQVLAASTSLESDFTNLRQIQNALQSTTKSSGSSSKEDLMQTPILTDYPTPDLKRLENLKYSMTDLVKRTSRLQHELDQMLEIYHQCMTVASEKCIMAEEYIHNKTLDKK